MLLNKFCNFRFIANIFAAAFLSKNSGSFTTYSFPRGTVQKFGSKRAAQRFEQCLRFLEINMRPALEVMNAEKFYDKTVQKSATELVQMAITDAIEDISENIKLSNETKDKLTRKLKSIKLWVMHPEDILNSSKIEALYNELAIVKSDSLTDLTRSISRHNRKLLLQPHDSWMRTLITVIEFQSPAYFPELNILSE